MSRSRKLSDSRIIKIALFGVIVLACIYGTIYIMVNKSMETMIQMIDAEKIEGIESIQENSKLLIEMYGNIIDAMKWIIGLAIGRYLARETAQNIGNGMAGKPSEYEDK